MSSLHLQKQAGLDFGKFIKSGVVYFSKSLVDTARKASSARDLMQRMELDVASETQRWKLK